MQPDSSNAEIDENRTKTALGIDITDPLNRRTAKIAVNPVTRGVIVEIV